MENVEELQAFSLEEMFAPGRAASLNKTDKVLILNFQDILVVDRAPGQQSLVGGDETIDLLFKLRQDGVTICLAARAQDQLEVWEKIFSRLRAAGLSQIVQYVVYDNETNFTARVALACKMVFEQPSDNNKNLMTTFFCIDNDPRNLRCCRDRYGMGIFLVTMSSRQPADVNAGQLNAALKAAEEHYNQQTNHKPSVEPLKKFDLMHWLIITFVPYFLIQLISLAQFLPTIPLLNVKKNNTARKDINTALLGELRILFLWIYGFDGLKVSNLEIVYPDLTGNSSKKLDYYRPLSNGLLLAAFLGLPSRPTAMPDGKGNYYPELSIKQLFKNFIGGWDFDQNTPRTKFILGALVFPKFIIALVKIFTLPFKLLINVVKLFTEVLPFLLRALIHLPTSVLIVQTLIMLKAQRSLFFKIPVVILLGFLALIFGVVEHALKIIFLLGSALTSPERSARMAFENARSLKIEWLGYTLGLINSIFSVLVSTVLWTIMLPLAVGTLITLFPALLPAISSLLHLPFITNTLAWLSQSTWLVSSVSGISAALTTIGSFLGTVFGSTVVALAGLVDVKVSIAVVFFGAAVGALTAPVAILLTAATDWLSNQWASWHKAKDLPDALGVPLLEKHQDFSCSKASSNLVNEKSNAAKASQVASMSVDAAGSKQDKPDATKPLEQPGNSHNLGQISSNTL